jgi:ABC-2 type transport system permease protein
MALWWRAIQRATTTTPVSGTTRRGERRTLIPRAAAWLPTNAFGAIVAKELRYTWRDPRRRAGILALAMAGILPVFAFRGLSTSSPRLCLVAAWPSLNIGFNANAFGFDGERIWSDVAAGVSVITQLTARTVARVLFALPVIGLLLAGFAALSHSLVGLVPAVGLVAAAIGVSSGFAAVMSVNTPIAMPDSGSGNIFGGGTGGQNAAAGGAAFGALFGTAFAVSPVLIATLVLPEHSAAQGLVLASGLVVGWIGWRIGLRRATGRGRPGPAELLAKLTRA